jgi:hypothetical protein
MTDQPLPAFTDRDGDTVSLLGRLANGDAYPATLDDLIDQVAALSAEQRAVVREAIPRDPLERDHDLATVVRKAINNCEGREKGTGVLLGFEAVYDLVMGLMSERDAYKRAKQENDERFMVERDDARKERDTAISERDAAIGEATRIRRRDAELVQGLLDAKARIAELEREAEGMKARADAANNKLARYDEIVARMRPVVEAARAAQKNADSYLRCVSEFCESGDKGVCPCAGACGEWLGHHESTNDKLDSALRAFDAGTPAAEDMNDAERADEWQRQYTETCGQLGDALREADKLRAEVTTLTGSIEEAKRQVGETAEDYKHSREQREQLAEQLKRLIAENEKLRAEAATAAERQRASDADLHTRWPYVLVSAWPLVTDPKPREEAKCAYDCAKFSAHTDCPVHGISRPGQGARPDSCLECGYHEGMHRESLPASESAKCWTCGRWYRLPQPAVETPQDDGVCADAILAARAAIEALFRRNVALHTALNDIAVVSGDNPRVREIVAMARRAK